MMVQTIKATPFGVKRIYSIDGECVWSEYLQWAPLKRDNSTPVSHRVTKNDVHQFINRYRLNAAHLVQSQSVSV